MDFNPEILQELLEQDLSQPTDELTAFRGDCLKRSLLKKYVGKSKDHALERAAFENFLAVNSRISSFVIDESFLATELFKTWRQLIHTAVMSGDLQSCTINLAGALAEGACGPGASIGSADGTFFTKMFDSHLTTTSGFLYDHYVSGISDRWLEAEYLRLQDYTVKTVPGSKLSSVPKDRTKRRTTCKEPILNMFYQLGIKCQIGRLLKRHFRLDLETQQRFNKALAKSGSLSGHLATVDLKDASDSISVELVRLLFPREAYYALMRARSPRCHVGKQLVDLAMIATMGNGFCFSLMTLIFAALVRALHIVNDVEWEPNLTSGVYGDDIILPSKLAPQLYEALSSTGLVVNVEKSFIDGPFRESCGGDYFNGHDVRGIYIKRFTCEAHCYSAFNRLHFWALRHGIGLAKTLGYLLGLAPFRPVPADAGFDAGFIVTSAELTNPRFAKEQDSHRCIGGVFTLTSQAPRTKGHQLEHQSPEVGQLVYHGLRPKRCVRENAGERFTNFHGGLIAFLGGYVRNDQILMRPDEDLGTQYRVVRQTTPSWDWIPHAGVTCRGLSASWLRLLNRA